MKKRVFINYLNRCFFIFFVCMTGFLAGCLNGEVFFDPDTGVTESPVSSPTAGVTDITPTAPVSPEATPKPSATEPSATATMPVTPTPEAPVTSAVTETPTPTPAPLSTRDADTVSLMFAGDMCLSSNYFPYITYTASGYDVTRLFSDEYLSLMRSADVFFVNNEFPFTDSEKKLSGKLYNFKADPALVKLYKDIGVDLCGLANNHVYDYGEESLTDTLDTLKSVEIAYVGAGRNISEASEPVYFIVNGVKIAYVMASKAEKNRKTPEATDSSAGILLCYDSGKFLKAIREANEHADVVIAVVHWGKENSELLEEDQKELAMSYIDAGADAVVGGHSHVIQGVDHYKGKPIFYSIGDFWFDYYTEDTFLLELVITKKDGGFDMKPVIHPGVQREGKTEYVGGTNDGNRILSIVNELSGDAKIAVDGAVYDKAYAEKLDKSLFSYDVKKGEAEQISYTESDISGAKTGDIVRFGKYNTNGKKNDILWIVMNADEGKLDLVALNILDEMSFDDDNRDVDFSGSSIRQWLNGAFIDEAFSSGEKKKLSGRDGDLVRLLGYSELLELKAKGLDSAAKAAPTKYAFSKGIYCFDPVTSKIMCTDWKGYTYNDKAPGCYWLMDRGALPGTAMFVNEYGNAFTYGMFTGGYSLSDGLCGVRPVISVTR